MSAVGDKFTVRKIGITVFGNDEKEFSIAPWGIDQFVVNKVRSVLARRFEVRPVAYDKSAFLRDKSAFFRARGRGRPSRPACERRPKLGHRCLHRRHPRLHPIWQHEPVPPRARHPGERGVERQSFRVCALPGDGGGRTHFHCRRHLARNSRQPGYGADDDVDPRSGARSRSIVDAGNLGRGAEHPAQKRPTELLDRNLPGTIKNMRLLQ